MNTSYFRNISKIHGPVVSISRSPPWWYNGPEFQALAPPLDLVHEAHRGVNEQIYSIKYATMVLLPLNPRRIYDHIVAMYGADCTLICHEDLSIRGRWCHRRFVAHWFEDALGIEVPEWAPPAKSKVTLMW